MNSSSRHDGQAVFIPADKRAAAEALGILKPRAERVTLDATLEIANLAELIGKLVEDKNVFLRGTEVVTVDEQTGEVRPMRPGRFCGWIEQFCRIERGSRDRHSFSRETAATILEQDNFLSQLRRLQAVHLVRLPVRRPEGSVELLAPGYDDQSRIYTIDGLEYTPDLSLSEAMGSLVSLLREYPWGDLDLAEGDILKSRSFAVYLVAVLGVFCRGMFPPRTKRPMIIFVGNQAGIGKTTLAALPLIAVFGDAPSTKLPRREEEVEKTLQAKALTMAPFVFFDNVAGTLSSDALNQFVTASSLSGRVMGGNREVYEVPNVSQVFVTGNALNLTEDIMRRSLVIELFLPIDSRGRRFSQSISDAYLAEPTTRSKILAALWALVQNWDECGRPVHPAPLESFEEWTGTLAEMVKRAGCADALTVPDVSIGGDQESRDWHNLLVALAGEVPRGGKEFSRVEIVHKARELGVLENLVGYEGEADLLPAENKKFGKRLQRWLGRELTDSFGRQVVFGKRRHNWGKTYPCTILRPDDSEQGTAAEYDTKIEQEQPENGSESEQTSES